MFFQDTIVPICEVNLVRKMADLLKSVECMETSLEDATKKARLKLQKEWLNFKNGCVFVCLSFSEMLLSHSDPVYNISGRTLH